MSQLPGMNRDPDSRSSLIRPTGNDILFESFQNLANWRHEGSGRMLLDTNETGILRLECIGSTQGAAGAHAFCVQDFPDGIALEYDLKVLTSNGLVITFIAMKGFNGGDMFDGSMPPRKGVFADYVGNARLLSYHVSISRYDDNGKHTGVSNWRKNPGMKLMSTGKDPCREINRWYRISIIKDGPHLQLGVDGVLAHEFIDDAAKGLPQGGKIGFRAIGSDVRMLIRNLRVTALRR